MTRLTPNKSLQPTPIGVGSSAFADNFTDPAWLSFCRSAKKSPRKTLLT